MVDGRILSHFKNLAMKYQCDPKELRIALSLPNGMMHLDVLNIKEQKIGETSLKDIVNISFDVLGLEQRAVNAVQKNFPIVAEQNQIPVNEMNLRFWVTKSNTIGLHAMKSPVKQQGEELLINYDEQAIAVKGLESKEFLTE